MIKTSLEVPLLRQDPLALDPPTPTNYPPAPPPSKANYLKEKPALKGLKGWPFMCMSWHLIRHWLKDGRPAVFLPEGFQYCTWGDGELGHSNAHGVVDGVGHRGQRRDNRPFSYASDPKGVSWIGHLYYDSVNHRQIEAGHHPIVQQAGVKQLPFITHEVFFVDGPAHPLDGAPLHLPFHVTGMDGLAGILEGGAAQHLHFAGIRIYFHIHQGSSERAAHSLGVEVASAHYWSAGIVEF